MRSALRSTALLERVCVFALPPCISVSVCFVPLCPRVSGAWMCVIETRCVLLCSKASHLCGAFRRLLTLLPHFHPTLEYWGVIFRVCSSSLVETEPILTYTATEHRQASGKDKMWCFAVVRVNTILKCMWGVWFTEIQVSVFSTMMLGVTFNINSFKPYLHTHSPLACLNILVPVFGVTCAVSYTLFSPISQTVWAVCAFISWH